jgi:hypothetical protein
MTPRYLATLCLCGLATATVGCAQKSVKAAAPVAVAPTPSLADSKPLTTIAPDTTATPPAEDVSPPPSPAATNTPPLPVTPARPKPAPPVRKPSADAPAENTAEQTSRPAAPQISPQISRGDQATFQRKTEDDITVAQSNLQQSAGKQLSAAQHDLVEKIQSFLKQSQEASKTGDWARAQNLSQKARLLSNELVESL